MAPPTTRPNLSLFKGWVQTTLPDGRVGWRQMPPQPPIRGLLGADAMGWAGPTPTSPSDNWFARNSFKNPADFDRFSGAVRAGQISGLGQEDSVPGHLLVKPVGAAAPQPPAGRRAATLPANSSSSAKQTPADPRANGGDLGERYKEVMIGREGNRNDVYPDSLGKPTVGIGHLVTPGDHLKLRDVISDDRKEALWKADSEKALKAAQRQAAEAGVDDPNFHLALADVNFQLGTGWNDGPKSFRPTWDLIVAGKYKQAADRLKGSRWYRQTPDRVENFRKALLALPPKAR